MNIKILDSWLREYLKTGASIKQISEALSLTSVSVERIEKFSDKDFVYDIEITTNRPDLMSVIGIARETAAVLPHFGFKAEFVPPHYSKPESVVKNILPITIENDSKLVNRIIAIIMEIELKESPEFIKKRLEASGIRSINNVIDVTNYIMREIGHPTHVFDYDRLNTKKLIIRESKKGEKIVTLDQKEHILPGGDIIADNGSGEIVDLLGIMGTANSVVTENTKRIVLFLDNNDPYHIRRTSMNLAVRTEAAVLNEKNIDPELAMEALLRGIELYKQTAKGKLLSNIIDLYPNKPTTKAVIVSSEKINNIIGVAIPIETSIEILTKLGFSVKAESDKAIIRVPTWRTNDVEIEEDIIEEIARVYGYHKLPNILPPLHNEMIYNMSEDDFFWERRMKSAFKYWGFTEVYTYSMVSESLLEGPVEEAITLSNPLSEDMVHMRRTLVPSLLQVLKENPLYSDVKIFELANIYIPRPNNLPDEILTLAGVVKRSEISFYEIKGIIEQLMTDFGISNFTFKHRENGGLGATIYIDHEVLGDIELLDDSTADFELNFRTMLKHASLKKKYKPVAKFPPVIEDVRLEVNPNISYEKIISIIKKMSKLVTNVSLLDVYNDKKTFRIYYQDPEKNLTNEEVSKEREKIYEALEKESGAEIV